ncbi:hypothetical protein [Shinella sp. M31]|uniref:hypothetical protein n=1 Tax=Shinella sp. M31 TaxID=3368615 RepID=UPI003B9F45AF
MKITDEMVEAVARVLANDLVEIGLTSESPIARSDGKTMPLWETYLNLAYTALTAALAVQTQQGVEAGPAPYTSLEGRDFECAGEPLAGKEMEEGLRHQAEYLDQLKEDQE